MADMNFSSRDGIKKYSPATTMPKQPSSLGKAIKRLPSDLAIHQPLTADKKGTDVTVPSVGVERTPSHSPWLELKEQSVFAYESGLLPRSIDSRQKAITIALMGREVGLTPMQALCGIYVVNGMTAMRGSLMLRLIYERVAGARITVLTPPEKAKEECAVEMQRPQGKPQVFRFTLEDAEKAGFLHKPIWQQHTATMLRWAAIRTGARIVFADAIAGCYMEDELPPKEAKAPVETSEETIPESVASPDPVLAPEAIVATSPVPESVAPEPVKATATVPLPSRILVRDLPAMKKVTEKQVYRLYAIAHEKQWSRQDVGEQMEKWFHKRDAKALNRTEYDRLCNFLLSTHQQGSGDSAAG